MCSIPTGIVAFLFTDIEGSTTRWETDPRAMNLALARHDTLLRSAIESQRGYVFKTVGDAFCAAFSTPQAALRAALQAQYAFTEEPWPAEVGSLRVRMALHAGAAEEREGDYFGQPVNRVARLLSAGHGRQVLLPEVVYEMLRDALPPGVSLLDLGEHRLKDLTRPEHVFQVLAPGLPTEFPPLRTLDAHPNNLPRQATALIGRGSETLAVASLIARQETALVTLTGPAGTGKTRLALQVAADMLEDLKDGVWFVDLSTLRDPRLVASTIAQALGVKEAGGQPPVDCLEQYLRDKQMLLVLDNFEQVAEAASDVALLLAACPELKVLVTSRVPLRTRSEHEFPVVPLPVPRLDATHRVPPLHRLTQFEAVRLFIERSQAVKPDFEVNNDNAPAVAEICVRLDGLPLAIELAAARIRLFPPQAMLGRLGHGLGLLTGGACDLPVRQRTLRAAIEWSYDLLSPGEQQFFRRIAVFRGGGTLEALSAVCDSWTEDERSLKPLQVEVLEGVESLVEKSLLQQREGRDGEPRFWTLETIHEYANEKLEESGEGEEMRRRHAYYFLRLTENTEDHLTGPDQLLWLDRLEDEYDNLRAALTWDLESPSRALHSLRLAASLTWFWYFRGYLREGRGWLDRAIENVAEAERTAVAGKALNAAGVAAFLQNDLQPARSYLESALAIWRELNDRRGTAFALVFLGRVLSQEGDRSGARLIEEGAAVFEQIGERWGLALAFDFLGEVARDEGDEKRATQLHDESMTLYREIAHRWGVALELSNFGEVAMRRGDYASARQPLEEAVAIQREVGDKSALGWALRNLAEVARHAGDRQKAEELLSESRELFRQLGRRSEDEVTEGVGGAEDPLPARRRD